MNKKGLSEVVTTVLIVLLVVAAIVTIWTYVQPAIKNTAKGIGGTAECLSVDLSAQSCVLNKYANGSIASANVTVKRGTDTTDVVSIIYLFDSASGRTSKEDSTVVNALEVKTIPILLSLVENTTSVTVTAKIKTTSGDTVTCEPVSTAITCA